MRVDFVKKKVLLQSSLDFDQMGLLQSVIESFYQAMITDSSQTNTVKTAEDIELLCAALGIDLDNSCESLEQNDL